MDSGDMVGPSSSGSWHAGILIVGGGLVLGGLSLWWSGTAEAETRTKIIPLDEVGPGGGAEVVLAGNLVALSVPDGEGASVGTLECRVENSADPLVVERDGSLESLMIADIDSDGVEDGLLTIRSVGSGSFVQLVLLGIDEEGGIQARQLPLGTQVLPDGYGGHDKVEVRPAPESDGSAQQVVRSFPTYESTDAQATPTGATGQVVFDATRWSWRRDD